MEENGEQEKAYLLEEHSNDSKPASTRGRNASAINIDLLNLKESFCILLGVSFGTGVLVIPYTVRELGVVAFAILVVIVVIFLCFCANLLSKSIQLYAEELDTPELIRDPYPAVAELAGGVIFRKAAITILYITVICGCISFVLLISTILKDLIYIGNFSNDNLIRIWSVVVVSCITPVMFLGTYSDMKIPTMVALSTSSVSMIAILINCFLAYYVYDIRPNHDLTRVHSKKGQFLLSLGSIVFVLTGAAFTVPNLVVISSNAPKFGKSIFATYVALVFIYLFSGIIPYYTLGEYVTPSITATFYQIIKIRKVGLLFKVLTIAIQVLMMMHLLMASLLVLNPCYLHMEDYFNIPYEMNIKRVVIRSGFMLSILVICCLIPQFTFIIGIAGGVPLTFIGIIFPLIIYTRMFDMKFYQKFIFFILLIVSISFTVGNLIFSILDFL